MENNTEELVFENKGKPNIHRVCIWCRHHTAVHGAQFRHYCNLHKCKVSELRECTDFEMYAPKYKTDKIVKEMADELFAMCKREHASMLLRLWADRYTLLRYMDRTCETCAGYNDGRFDSMDCAGCVDMCNWEWEGV